MSYFVSSPKLASLLFLLNPSVSQFAAREVWSSIMMGYWPVWCLATRTEANRKDGSCFPMRYSDGLLALSAVEPKLTVRYKYQETCSSVLQISCFKKGRGHLRLLHKGKNKPITLYDWCRLFITECKNTASTQLLDKINSLIAVWIHCKIWYDMIAAGVVKGLLWKIKYKGENN